MKFGRFEIGGRKRLGAFENQWIIDLNAAYQMLLLEKGTLDASVMANSEIPLDLRAFIKKMRHSVW